MIDNIFREEVGKKEEFLTVHGKGCLRRNSSLWM